MRPILDCSRDRDHTDGATSFRQDSEIRALSGPFHIQNLGYETCAPPNCYCLILVQLHQLFVDDERIIRKNIELCVPFPLYPQSPCRERAQIQDGQDPSDRVLGLPLRG